MDKEVKRILKSFIPGILLVAILWAVKLVEWKTGQLFADYGVFPRTSSGIRGVLFSPFIHGDFKHLISNSVPLLVLGAGLFYFYKSLAYKVFVWVFFLAGFWLWLGGRESFHIGASGIIYGLTTFLFFSGVFRRDTRLMAFSLVVVFLYGGMVWGIFPLFTGISWEGHLFGSLAGLLMAFVYRKEGPQRKIYKWEDEEEEEDDENAYWKLPQQKAQPTDEPSAEKPLNIRYIYTPELKTRHPGQPDNDNEKN